METTPKKSMLEEVLAPFIEGAQHTYSNVMGDLETKGPLAVGAAVVGDALAGMGMNPIRIPATNSLMFGKLPAVTPVGSFLQHPAVQQSGGNLIQALGTLRNDAITGNGTDLFNKMADSKIIRYYTGATKGNQGWHVTPITLDEIGNEVAGKPVDILGTKKAANALKDKLMEQLLTPR